MEKVPTPILPRDPENKQMRLGPQFTGTALRYKEALSSVLKHLKGQEKGRGVDTPTGKSKRQPFIVTILSTWPALALPNGNT